MKVSGETIVCIVLRQKNRTCLSKRQPTEMREARAQRLVRIPVWTENAIFGKGVNLELLIRGVPYE